VGEAQRNPPTTHSAGRPVIRSKASKRFFLKKEAKTFFQFSIVGWAALQPIAQARNGALFAAGIDRQPTKSAKVFWFFFSKKNRCLPKPQ